MLRSFVIDTDRNLNEENGDLLGTKCYANQLVDTIKSIPEEQAYTVGLYGSWGSGKSTIIRTAKKNLDEDRDKNIRVIIYDAWKYSGDSFRRMFLLHLQNELGLSTSPEMERFYKAVTEEIKPNLALRKRGIAYLVIASFLILLAINLVILIGNQDARIWVTLVLSAITLFSVSLGGNLFYELKVSQTKNILFAPEQFEECFRQMMEKVLKKKVWYKKLYSNVKSFFCNETPEVSDLDKLVIVIDNLDRCDTEVVYSMLTDIKTFLGTEKYDVIFVIPVDDAALKKHLIAKHNEKPSEDVYDDAEEFLRKFFNVVIRIKPHRSDDLLHYINELNKDQNLGFDPNTLALVVNEYAKNPRRILQMLNNLTVEQSLYEEDFAQRNETLIATCLILREHYPDKVTEILKNTTILSDDKFYDNPFLPKAKITLKRAKTNDILTILTNTENALSRISPEIKDALDAYNSDSILSYIHEDALRTDIFIEINRKLLEAKNSMATDSLEQFVECIATVNVAEPLRHNELRDMDEKLSSIYDRVPMDIANPEAICKFANDLHRWGMNKLKNSLLTFVKNSDNAQYSSYAGYVRSVISTFTTKADCEEMRDFAENYMCNSAKIDTYHLTETQRKYLLTNTFVEKIIANIKSINDERLQSILEWSFANLTNIKSSSYVALINKLVELVNPRDGKTADQLCEYVEFALPIFKAISQDIDGSILEKFYNGSIMNKRTTPRGIRESIIREVDERKAQILAEFCFEVYRLSGRTFSINPNLEIIQSKCEKYVKNQLIQMNQKGISLVPFRTNILAFEEKDDMWYELISFAFEKDAAGKTLDNEKLKGKLQFMFDNRENAKALDVLVKLTEEENICNLFITLLNLDDYEGLNNLPVSLLPRIISRYTPENASKFKKNNAMLKIVLQKGSSTQKEQVTKTLIDRINNDEDMIGTLDIVDSYEKWKIADKSVLRGLLIRKMPEEPETTNGDVVNLTEVQQRIKDILPKLQ